MTGVLGTQLRAGRWHLVSSVSSASFSARNFGVVRVTGHVPIVASWVDVDDSGRPSGVSAELDLAGIDTGNARRDRELRGPRLLDTAQFPTMTFAGGPRHPAGEGWEFVGRLAGRGRTVDLTVVAGPARETAPGVLTVHATALFDRRVLGIAAPRILIGRRIVVTIDVSYRRPE